MASSKIKIFDALLYLLKLVQVHVFCNRYFCAILRGSLPFRLHERVFRHLYFEGEFTVKLPGGVRCEIWHPGNRIENTLFWGGIYGSWEAKSLELWCKLSRSSYEILDIGANTGVYSIFAKAQNPLAKIHYFEPNQCFHPAFKQNCNLNSFDIKMHDFALGNCNCLGEIEDFSGKYNTIPVSFRTIDSLIDAGLIGKVDLLKLDVEGLEIQVLEGFKFYLARYKPAILIEVLTENIAVDLDGFFREFSYLYFNIDEKGIVKQESHIRKSFTYNILLCNESQACFLGLRS